MTPNLSAILRDFSNEHKQLDKCFVIVIKGRFAEQTYQDSCGRNVVSVANC